MFNMAKGCRAECEDGGAYLGIRNNLDAEDIGKTRPAIVTKSAEDQILSFLVEDEDS